jgi:anthranilate phosphoribosyltransferase
VIANAGLAIFTGHQEEGLAKALDRAREALESGKALKAFKKLIEGQGK